MSVFVLTLLFFLSFFFLMAIGYIFQKKVLKKGCSLGPDCTCQNTPDPNAVRKDCENT